MTAAPLPTIQCVECGDVFPRRSASGATPKYCDECRKVYGSKGPGRGKARSLEHGPLLSVRDLMRGMEPSWHARAAGAALSGATGMPEDWSESIIGAINLLLTQGETPREIRVRLNSVVASGPRVKPQRTPAQALAELLYESDDEYTDDEEDAA